MTPSQARRELEIPSMLHTLTANQRHTLQQAVKNSGGNLGMVIHPFCHEKDELFQKLSTAGIISHERHVQPYLNALGQFAVDANLPLLIFEEASQIAATHKRIAARRRPGTTAYVVTPRGTPKPLHQSWEEVINELKEWNVHTLHLAGAFYSADPRIFSCLTTAKSELETRAPGLTVRVHLPAAFDLLAEIKKTYP